MSENELKAIEARLHDEYVRDGTNIIKTSVVASLVAEVRRLRELIADTMDRNGYLRSHGHDLCPWCGTADGVSNYHPDGCPAFTVDGSVR